MGEFDAEIVHQYEHETWSRCADLYLDGFAGLTQETLPFLMWRIDLALNRPGNEGVAFRDVFCSHFYVTTSGFFSDPALNLCIQEMGADRILFAVDYPFVPNAPGPKWMERLMLNAEDKAKILHGNAERMLGV